MHNSIAVATCMHSQHIGCSFDGCSQHDLGMAGGCGQCPGTGFQKIGAYAMN